MFGTRRVRGAMGEMISFSKSIILFVVSFELDWFGMKCWMFLVLVWCVGSVQFS